MAVEFRIQATEGDRYGEHNRAAFLTAGYHIAALHTEPMSRRVVSRYGFKEYVPFQIYAWMPVIDMDVIRSLAPDE